METCIRDSQFVFLICTPSFAEKANKGVGGVGHEKSIVTGELFLGAPPETKFVPVIRRGSPESALPTYLKSKVFVDMRDDDQFVICSEDIVRHVYDVPVFVRPSLGQKPTFVASTTPRFDLALRRKQQKPSDHKRNFDLKRFKELRDYAYKSDGLNLDSDDAARWAEERMNDSALFDLDRYKKLRDFAYLANGLDLDAEDAAQWATERMKDGPEFDLARFKKLRDFAYLAYGLDLDAEDVAQWATERMGDGPEFDLARFKELRDFAYLADGLDLDAEGAAQWATERMKDGSEFDLMRFKELRDFAYSADGLNLDPEDAAKWALSRLKD